MTASRRRTRIDARNGCHDATIFDIREKVNLKYLYFSVNNLVLLWITSKMKLYQTKSTRACGYFGPKMR